MAHVRQSVLSDALELAPILRQADLDELAATRDNDPLFALVYPFTDLTSQRYSMIGDDDEVVGMFGVNAEGAVWMLSSDLLYEKYKRQFIIEARYWIEILQGPHDLIFNYVDTRNRTAIRWLRFCGFTVQEPPVPYGPDGLPFHLLFRHRRNT